ncbi:hypothetical protein CEXT_335391 [Caerostris extrusa]|uniref:Uncharacterized protein n=1 Tax=Caerostris extrusa TaxID=172846 RepID=A0AAV4XKI4_CAEEX|nr:hypothetical protein CEXT_335391 [Caerostris extrusa]
MCYDTVLSDDVNLQMTESTKYLALDEFWTLNPCMGLMVSTDCPHLTFSETAIQILVDFSAKLVKTPTFEDNTILQFACGDTRTLCDENRFEDEFLMLP